MSLAALQPRIFGELSSDGRLLFVTRIIRLFAYGMLSVVLALYLASLGFSDTRIGLLLSLTLVGDIVISLWLTTSADRAGRRRMLIVGAMLMVFAAVLFSMTASFPLLLIAAIIGVISPSGNEVGPFLPIEQAALAQTVSDSHRTSAFAWYNLVGSLATALGALAGGGLVQALQKAGFQAVNSYRVMVVIYGAAGLALVCLFLMLSDATEVTPRTPEGPGPNACAMLGLHRSRRVVFTLAALFGLDAFGGGFVIQSFLAYWFYLKFGANPATLGGIFFGANVLAAFSSLAAVAVAKRIGLVNTMVFTHLPSNVLLILVPLMPNLPLAIAILLLRFSISQMDVPTRQSYTIAIVHPDERSAASGVTGVARSVGASVPPLLTGIFLSHASLMGLPFFLAGAVKIVYDVMLYVKFMALKPPEECFHPHAESGEKRSQAAKANSL
jgi:MFS family permease